MTAPEILKELEAMGNESTRKTLMRHGAKDPCFGVKIGDMQPLRKRIKKDHDLALALYATGNYDAMYLAGLIADDAKMTKRDLRTWAKQAYGGCLPGTTVPSVATGSLHGPALALEWLESTNERIASIGWSTLNCLLSVKPDADLETLDLESLLQRVEREIHAAPNAVRETMNGFVIALGCYIESLSDRALEAAEAIGPVDIDHGETACQTPFAPDYIRKVRKMGRLGKKRKSAKC